MEPLVFHDGRRNQRAALPQRVGYLAEKGITMPAFTSDKRLCANADKSAIVDCESDEAAFVVCGEGGTVSAEDAEKYGLTPPAPKASGATDAGQVPEMKHLSSAPENKAKQGPAETKAPADEPTMTLGKGKDG